MRTRAFAAALFAAALVLLPTAALAEIGEPTTVAGADPTGGDQASIYAGGDQDGAPHDGREDSSPGDEEGSSPGADDGDDGRDADPSPADGADDAEDDGGDEDGEGHEDDGSPPAPVMDVRNAVLRWGLSNESNNMSHAPGRFNFFSAGRIPDPGSGGSTVTQTQWSRSAGNVAIEKWDGTGYVPATWAGLRTDTTGAPIASASSGRFSGHQFVFSGGTGTLDRSTGSATISWDGDVTVVYYSGYTFFYLADPELVVEDGVGTLHATLGGFASSQQDMGLWGPLPETRVVVAELGSLDLTGDSRGFTANPSYLGRAVTGVDQVRNGAFWGSFPQAFVDFQSLTGAADFWFSTGTSFDEHKVPLPLTVSFDASEAVEPPAPEAPEERDAVRNDIVLPPSPAPPAVAPPAAPQTLAAPPPAAAPVVAAVFRQWGTGATVRAADPVAPQAARTLWWWIGAVSLTLAGGSVAGTLAFTSVPTRR